MNGVGVLCVDDDPDLLALTATHLERTDDAFDVTTTTDPNEALELLSRTACDCVVSDYDMPSMDGLALLESVRERHPDLPFILFTGKGSEEVASEAIASGVTDYLQKGAGGDRYDLLANRIRNAVEQHRAGRRAESLDRVRGILRDVNRSLVRAEDREALEHRVCEIVASADPYRMVCMATPDGAGDVTMRVRVGDGSFADDPRPTVAPLATEALTADEIVTVALDDESVAERDGVLNEYVAAGAIPVVYDGEAYGSLCLFADDGDAFDTRERALLAEIGEDLAHAIYRAELTDRLRRAERIITNLPVGVYRNSPLPDGTLLAVNPALVDLFDAADEDDLRGRPFRELYADPDDRDQFLSALRENGVVRGMELDLETLSGEPFRASVTGIMTEEDGKQYFDGVIRDVTDRQEHERKLRVYERLVEIAPTGAFRATDECEVREVNPALADLLGDGSTTGESVADLTAELDVDLERLETLLERLHSSGTVSGFAVEVQDADGRRRRLAIDATLLDRDDGFDVVGWVSGDDGSLS